MPIVNLANIWYLIPVLVVFVLCIYLAQSFKSNTIPCIMLLVFLTLLVGHTIEISIVPNVSLVICIIIDEAFTFAAFLSFLWLDRVQVENNKKKKGKKEKVIKDDGLDLLFKKV